jgi:hypothetical protein
MTDAFDGVFGDSAEDREAAPAAPAAQPNPLPEGPAPAAALPEAPLTPAPAAETPPGFVPLGALDDERHKRRNLEQELERLRQPQGQRPDAPQIPDPVEDPQGYQAYLDQRETTIIWRSITAPSQMLANKEHGAEVVREAAEAFAAEVQQKPWLLQEMHRQQHPYDWVVQRHRRETALASVGPDDIKAFQDWKASQAAGNTPAAASPAPAAPPPPKPRPSINRLPSAGGIKPGEVPVHPGAAFDTVFK